MVQVGPLKTSRTLAAEVERLALDRTQGAPVSADDLQALEHTLAEAAIPSLDPVFALHAGELIEEMRAAGDSIGSVVEVVAVNVPPLAGAAALPEPQTAADGCPWRAQRGRSL